jgi:predicted  nucleic acid-binding Zn-ribbon protein
MSKDIALEPTAGEAADIEAAVVALVAEMKRANEKMESDQHEIDRLKAQTRDTLSKLKAA